MKERERENVRGREGLIPRHGELVEGYRNSYRTKGRKEIDCVYPLKLLIWSRGPTTREELLYEIIGLI